MSEVEVTGANQPLGGAVMDLSISRTRKVKSLHYFFVHNTLTHGHVSYIMENLRLISIKSICKI